VAYDAALLPSGKRRLRCHYWLQQGQPASVSRPEIRQCSRFCRSHRSPCEPSRRRCAACLRGMDVIAEVTTGERLLIRLTRHGSRRRFDGRQTSEAFRLMLHGLSLGESHMPGKRRGLRDRKLASGHKGVFTANDAGSSPRSGGIASSQAKWQRDSLRATWDDVAQFGIPEGARIEFERTVPEGERVRFSGASYRISALREPRWYRLSRLGARDEDSPCA